MSRYLPLPRLTIEYHALVSTVAADAAVAFTATTVPTATVAAATAMVAQVRRRRPRTFAAASGGLLSVTDTSFLSGRVERGEIRRGRVATAGSCRPSRSTARRRRRRRWTRPGPPGPCRWCG